MRWRVGAKMKMANEDIIEQQFRSDTLCEYEWPEKVNLEKTTCMS